MNVNSEALGLSKNIADLHSVATTIWQRGFEAIEHGNTASSERKTPQGMLGQVQ